jgi:alpha-mannosidase
MLEEIKKRVKEGRWEVTASTWVETDKNMPNGESLSRHILYTKKYLSDLLDMDPDSLQIDFEPDTFGHNGNVPEILNKGGIKYYYHCRGYDGYHIYKWQAPSGSSVLVYREPQWYNAEISPVMALHVPEFCTKHGIDTMLKVYGVGDHGGGPTRRDIERIMDMSTWPVFPEIRFGTFIEYFFNILSKIYDKLPVVKDELNFIFSGCYTTQTRIKMSNRIGEAKLNEAEAFSALSSAFVDGKYRSESFKKAWEKVLFNHFHDILPGSGVIDTREYAMGEFQKVLATANTEISASLRNIASKINTSELVAAEEDISETTSEGAGVGYGIESFGIPQAERGRGKTRIFHFFNSSAYERREGAEITVWDWDGDKERIEFRDADNNIVRHQRLEDETYRVWNSRYWGHTCMKLLVDVKVPAYGYSTYILKERDLVEVPVYLSNDPRVERPDEYVLENNLVKVTFDTRNASIISMIDKTNGKEMINPNRPAGIFRLIEEDDNKGMSSWIVGRYMNVYNLNENVKISEAHIDKSALRQWIKYRIYFRDSSLNVVIYLDKDSTMLKYRIECDWQERAKKGRYLPQLNFHMPVGYTCESYKYDIPFGTVVRNPMDMDVPGNSRIVGLNKESGEKSLMLVTKTKYGFRGFDNSMSLTLVRSSYDPDPYPDNGIHKINFAVGIVYGRSDIELVRKAYDYNHPISYVSNTIHDGPLPCSGSFMSLESGSVMLSSVKKPEDAPDNKLIVRAYEVEGKNAVAVLTFAKKIAKAYYVDLNEKPLENGGKATVDGDKVAFEVNAYGIASVCIEF